VGDGVTIFTVSDMCKLTLLEFRDGRIIQLEAPRHINMTMNVCSSNGQFRKSVVV
jgi:hypothetical protein